MKAKQLFDLYLESVRELEYMIAWNSWKQLPKTSKDIWSRLAKKLELKKKGGKNVRTKLTSKV